MLISLLQLETFSEGKLIVFRQSLLVFGAFARSITRTGGFQPACTLTIVCKRSFSTCPGSIMLTIPALDEQGSMCFYACTVMLARLATSMWNAMFGRTSIIPSAGMRCSFRVALFVGSKQIDLFYLKRTLTFPKFLSCRHICMATRSATCV